MEGNMSRNMPLVTKIPVLALVAILSIAATSSVNAAAAATTQTAPKVDELEEVWVVGKRLSEVIRKAEDQFFKAYNKVNRNHNYDVHCGEVLLSRDSLAMTRTCLPGFYVYNYLDLAGRAVPACASSSSSGDTYTPSGFSGGYYTGCTYAPMVPPALLAMEHREKYRKNVLQVIHSNGELLTMASKLAGLYGEMEAVQTRYVKIRGPVEPVRPRKTMTERRKSTRANSATRGGPHTL
jgi:hypothetical protein